MAAKKKPQISQPELLASLKETGHSVKGFTRKGDNLIVRLAPADLVNDAGGFIAIDVCTAAGLQARCNVFSSVQQDLLILTVLLPAEAPGAERMEQSESPQTATPKPQTD